MLDGGGLSCEASYMPHGETYESWRDASTKDLSPVITCQDTMAFMFHISVPLFMTRWALKGDGAKSLHPSHPSQWDNVKAHFLEHLDEIDTDLKAAGLPTLAENERQ